MADSDRDVDRLARSRSDYEARARSATAFAAIFALIAGASFVGELPRTASIISGCTALSALVAAFLHNAEARRVGVMLDGALAERDQAEQRRRVLISDVQRVDPLLIGVDRAVQDILPGGEVPSYVAREVDVALRAALAAAFRDGSPWLVVVEGPSKVGKSRALFEAVRYVARGQSVQIAAPRDGAALSDLVTRQGAPDETPTVLWLDDLEPFLNDGASLATLTSWRGGRTGRIVAATYGGKGSERLAGRGAGLDTIASAVLGSALEIQMTATCGTELTPLESSLSDSQLAALTRHGLAAYLVAAPELARKMSTRRHAIGEPDCPEGVAVASVVADWARCGRTDPIQESTLRRLWAHYIPADVPSTDEVFRVGMEWALRPVAGSIALMHGAESFVAFDWLVQYLDDSPITKDPRSELIWQEAVRTADDAQAVSVGDAAYAASRMTDALNAFSKSCGSLRPEVAALARVNLGLVLGQLDRSEEELAAYDAVVRRHGAADELAVREQVARALLNKALALEDMGRVDLALLASDDLIDRLDGSTEPAMVRWIARALQRKVSELFELRRLHEALARSDEATGRFSDVADGDVREAIASVLATKSTALELDRKDEALAACEELIARFGDAPESETRASVAWALANKCSLLRGLDRPDEAMTAHDDVVDRFGDAAEPEVRKQVAWSLYSKAELLYELQRPEEAIITCDDVAARFGEEDPLLQEVVAAALLIKASVLRERGQENGCLDLLNTIITHLGESTSSGLRVCVACAYRSKALTFLGLGRSRDAIAAYDAVVDRFEDATEPEVRQHVALSLCSKAAVLYDGERLDEAIRACDEVARRFDQDTDPTARQPIAHALYRKGFMLDELGRVDDAVALYEDVVTRFGASDDPEVQAEVSKALLTMGDALDEMGRVDEALSALDSVVARFGEAPEPALRENVATAMLNSAVMLMSLERMDEALYACDAMADRFNKAREPAIQSMRRQAAALAKRARAGWETSGSG